MITISVVWVFLLIMLSGIALLAALFYRDTGRFDRDMKDHWRTHAEYLEKQIVEMRAFTIPPRLHVHLDLKSGKLEAVLLLPTHPKN